MTTNVVRLNLRARWYQGLRHSFCPLAYHPIFSTYKVLLLNLDTMIVGKYWSIFWAFPAVVLWILI